MRLRRQPPCDAQPTDEVGRARVVGAMGVADDFWLAVAGAVEQPGMSGPHLLGTRLAWAAARTLRADGVGLSVTADPLMRIPLGASDAQAQAAERLQFTLGEGPCLDAFAQHTPIMATPPVITRCWPVFAHRLREQTPFRSVLAVPLGNLGAVDVLFVDPSGCTLMAMGEVLLVVQQVLTGILDDRLFSAVSGEVSWNTQPARRRGQVCVAMGLMTVALGVTQGEALAALRAHAFARGTEVEDVAARVVDGRTPPTAVLT